MEDIVSLTLRKWLTRVTLIAASITPASASALETKNVHYGPDMEQVLDVYLPSDKRGPKPILVFFHGGAFVGGDKNSCAPRLVAKLLSKGIAVACANYRLAPRMTYPAPMMDGARAVQWLRANAAEYGLDKTKVAVMGISAGAGIAQWIAFRPDLADPSALDRVLRQSTLVSAVVTVNAQATYDPSVIATELHTRQFPNFLAPLYGAKSMADLDDARFAMAERDASPIAQIHAGEPPLLSYYTSDVGTSLAPDSPPKAYLHHPAQGALIEKVARAKGAVAIVHSGGYYANGLIGFIDQAANFLQMHLTH